MRQPKRSEMNPPRGPPRPDPAPNHRLAAPEPRRGQRSSLGQRRAEECASRTQSLEERPLLERDEVGRDDGRDGH